MCQLCVAQHTQHSLRSFLCWNRNPCVILCIVYILTPFDVENYSWCVFWHQNSDTYSATLPQIYGCVLASISGIQPVLSFHYSDIISRDQSLTFYLAFELCFFFKQRLCHVSGSNFIAMSEKYLLDIMSCMYCFKLLFAICLHWIRHTMAVNIFAWAGVLRGINSDNISAIVLFGMTIWHISWHTPSAFDLAFYLAKIRIFVHVIGILPDM